MSDIKCPFCGTPMKIFCEFEPNNGIKCDHFKCWMCGALLYKPTRITKKQMKKFELKQS